jgi:hypothetical protein
MSPLNIYYSTGNSYPMKPTSKIKAGLRNPSKVLPYLMPKAVQPLRVAAAMKATAGNPSQKALLDDLREQDSWLLIVLDACRYPEFSEVAPTVFEGNLKKMTTEGHDTFEYVRSCWPESYPDVTYLSGATPVNSGTLEFDYESSAELYDGYVPKDHIGNIVDVWQSKWDERLGVVPPWYITPVAEEYFEEDQLVIHYFQPHAPYVGVEQELGHQNDESACPGKGEPIDVPIWSRIERGELTQSRLAELYRSNLEAVLYETAKIVKQAPHDNVVIMGDHGEALGEYWTYAHPRKDHPYILTAPWMEVTGTKDGWRSQLNVPDVAPSTSPTEDSSVESRLQELGYI